MKNIQYDIVYKLYKNEKLSQCLNCEIKLVVTIYSYKFHIYNKTTHRRFQNGKRFEKVLACIPDENIIILFPKYPHVTFP